MVYFQSTTGALLKLLTPNEFGLRNFYVPFLVSLSLFVIFAPGVFMNFYGEDGVVFPGNGTADKRSLLYHSMLFACAFVFLVLFFGAGMRMWPGLQQVESISGN